MNKNHYQHLVRRTRRFAIAAVRHWRSTPVQRVLAGTIVLVFLLSHGPLARAGTSYYYSPLCLGGWRGVEHVQGQPETDGALATQFNDQNSAVVRDASGQIFCGRFAADEKPNGAIKRLTVRLAIAIVDDMPVIPAEQFDQGVTLDAAVDSGAVFTIDDTPVVSASPSPTPVPSETFEIIPVDVPSPTPTSVESTSPEVPVETNVQPVDPPQEPVLQESPSAFLQWLGSIARADDTLTSSDMMNLDDVVTVRYSIDGQLWHNVGSLTRTELSHARFDLPPEALAHIDSLQVSITTAPGLGKSTVYLDSVWLEAEYESGITSIVDDVAEKVVDVLTLDATPTPLAEQTPTPMPKQKVTVWDFALNGQSEKAEQDLPWYPSDHSLPDTGFARATVSVVEGRVTVNGACTQAYFVVLIFRNRDDYILRPNQALYNAAFPCHGGTFRYDVDSLSSLVADDTYWVLVAQEGEGTPWQPISDVTPMYISTSVVEQ